MRRAGSIVSRVLDEAVEWVRAGVTTASIDRKIERRILALGGRPAFKGYRGFPAAACISVNEAVVHGLPGRRRLRDGDLVTIDVGVESERHHGDSARTYVVGRAPRGARRLCRTCERALRAGIAQARPGRRIRDIAAAIEEAVEGTGFAIVEEFVGHGIGRKLHESPQIPNRIDREVEDLDVRLRPGMVLAIEPMVNAGGPCVETLDDGWTVVTADGSLSCHFEHTVWVSEEGPVVLT